MPFQVVRQAGAAYHPEQLPCQQANILTIKHLANPLFDDVTFYGSIM